VAIVCFGIIAAFIVPICDVSDETEHLARAEMTSRGVFIPHWTGEDLGLERAYNLTGHKRIAHYNPGAGYDSIEAVNFFTSDLGKTVDHTPYDTEKINYTDNLVISAFEQNPFYGYLPPALGMIIAKMLDLNVIWLLWLGRIFNLLFYAGVISLAIRKTPILKMPLFFVACLPISIYQAASLSIDSMIIGLGILAVGYFLYMYSAKKDSLETREVIKFSALCLIHGQQRFIRHSAVFRILLFEQLISVFGAFGRFTVAEYFNITCDRHFVMGQKRCHAEFRYTWENRMHSGELCGAVRFADKHFGKLGSDLET
jgi:uncharacterized membrane protein